MDGLAQLSQTRLFRSFTRAQLEPLEPALRARTYPRGSYIFREGEIGTTLYLVTSGQVKISQTGLGGQETVLAVLVKGDSFGELALFDDSAERAADAQAMEVTGCLTLDRGPFLAFLSSRPALFAELLGQVARSLRESDATFSETAFLDIPGRIAKKLLELADKHGESVEAGTRISVRLPQGILAGMIGASRENVNRSLSRMAARGEITQANGYITIVRPRALRARF